MKVSSVLNLGLSRHNLLKFAKISDDVAQTAASSPVLTERQKFSRQNIFNLERGALDDQEIIMVKNIKDKIKHVLEIVNVPSNKIKSKLLFYKYLLNDPSSKQLQFKVDNPQITSISCSIKSKRGEEYLDLTLHGYFGDKKRFIINNEGEIIKGVNPIYSKEVAAHAHEFDVVYYSQHQINNLPFKNYFSMFISEIENFNKFLTQSETDVKSRPKFVEDPHFTIKQNVKLVSIHRNFDKLMSAIKNNSRIGIQRRKLADFCGVKLNNKQPTMQIDDINDYNQNVIISFPDIQGKSVVKLILFDKTSNKQYIFANGALVKDGDLISSKNGQKLKIFDFYTQDETEKFGIPKLLKTIDERLYEGHQKLRTLIGSKADV